MIKKKTQTFPIFLCIGYAPGNTGVTVCLKVLAVFKYVQPSHKENEEKRFRYCCIPVLYAKYRF